MSEKRSMLTPPSQDATWSSPPPISHLSLSQRAASAREHRMAQREQGLSADRLDYTGK